MSTYEQFLGLKPLGSAVGVSDPAVLVAAKNGSGNRAPLVVGANGLTVYDAALAALIGEVQASPTANTVLDRLKAIYAALTTAESPVPVGFRDPATGLLIDPTKTIFQASCDAWARPGDTTIYALEDAMLSSTDGTDLNVTTTPGCGIMVFDLSAMPWDKGVITRIDGFKSGVSTTTTAGQFKLAFFTQEPTVTAGAGNGDNKSSWLTIGNMQYGFGMCGVNLRALGKDGGVLSGSPGDQQQGVVVDRSALTNDKLYALQLANAAYPPLSAETFQYTLTFKPGF